MHYFVKNHLPGLALVALALILRLLWGDSPVGDTALREAAEAVGGRLGGYENAMEVMGRDAYQGGPGILPGGGGDGAFR